MMALLVTIAILGLIFWALCELISVMAGVIFVLLAAVLIVKLAREIFK